MTKIGLSKRLALIASMINKKSIVADIGCDHALLDIYITSSGIAKKSYACDIKEGAIKQALKNIKLYNATSVYVRKANGLDAIDKKDNVDTIVISGLGNKTIIDILGNNKKKLDNISTLIIQSNTKNGDVRKSITKFGYYISDEKLVLERNIIYTIIKFSKGSVKYNKKELLFGPVLLKNKNYLFNKLIDNEILEVKRILVKLPKRMIFKKISLYMKIAFLNANKTKK